MHTDSSRSRLDLFLNCQDEARTLFFKAAYVSSYLPDGFYVEAEQLAGLFFRS